MPFKLQKQEIHKPTAHWYTVYIQSPTWLSLRLKVIKQRGYKCELCPSVIDLTLHHLTYENVTQERQRELQLLCKRCHKEAHTEKLVPWMWRIYDEKWRPHAAKHDEPQFKSR